MQTYYLLSVQEESIRRAVCVCECVCTFKLTLCRGAHTGESALIALGVTVDGLVGLKENKPNTHLRHSSTYKKYEKYIHSVTKCPV